LGAIVLGVVVVTAGGCGTPTTTSQGAESPEQSSASPLPVARIDVVRPATGSSAEFDRAEKYPYGSIIDRVLLRGSTFSAVEDAVQAETARCMASVGWKYHPLPAATMMGSEDFTLPFSELAATRSKIGYGIMQTTDQTEDPNRLEMQSLDSKAQNEYRSALGDTGGSGCRGSAERLVYTDLPFFDPQYSWVSFEFSTALESDAEFARALKARNDCLAAHGYPDLAADRSELTTQAMEATGRGDPAAIDELRRREVELAVADTDCTRSTVLVVRPATEERMLDEWIADGKIPADWWPLRLS
jgi:hypothetical protein